jgi:hypothetical protein
LTFIGREVKIINSDVGLTVRRESGLQPLHRIRPINSIAEERP